MEGLFLHRFLLMGEDSEPYLIPNPEKAEKWEKPSPKWDRLTRKVWVIWDKGLEHSPISNQLAIENMRRKASASGFELTVVSTENVQELIGKETHDRIEEALRNKQIKADNIYLRSDLWRIALVARHGGVYFDSTFVLLEDLDWLVDIAFFPPELIFNRYGNLPRVLFSFHPWYGNPANWFVDKAANTKSQWHLGYESNFFAA